MTAALLGVLKGITRFEREVEPVFTLRFHTLGRALPWEMLCPDLPSLCAGRHLAASVDLTFDFPLHGNLGHQGFFSTSRFLY